MTIKSLLIILISAFSFSAYAEHHGGAAEEMAKDATEMTDDGMAKDGEEMMKKAEGEMTDDSDATDDGEEEAAEEGDAEEADAEEESPEAG